MNPMLVWHLEHEQLHEIVNSMKQWPRKRNLVFDIGSHHIVSGKCCQVLAMLVASSSGGLSTEQVPGAIQRQMETLLQHGFAEELHGSYFLTTRGNHTLQVREVLQSNKGRLIFDVSANSGTVWGLVCKLEANGWVSQEAPRSKIQRANIPPLAIADSESGGGEDIVCKIWYISSLDLNRMKKYLTCMLQSLQLLQGGTVVKIYHFQSPSYYNQLLDGSSTGELAQHLPLEDEDGSSIPPGPLELDVEMGNVPRQRAPPLRQPHQRLLQTLRVEQNHPEHETDTG